VKILGCLVFGAAVMLLVGCGSSSTAAFSPSPSPSATASGSAGKASAVDPCALVTAGDASSAAGKQVANLVSLGAPAIPGACFYGTQKGSAAVFVYAQVYKDAATADAVTVEQFQTAVASQIGQSSKDSKDVGGIGDRAYEFSVKNKSGSGMAILVFKGNVVFLIALEPTSGTSTVENLAKTAVTRLH
jgi:hypothetical protein